MSETTKEIEQGLAFLRACNPRGPVYAALKPVLEDLQRTHAASSSSSSSSASASASSASSASPSAIEGIVVALHKAMCDDGFVGIVEKPSSVPGFAGTIRELPPHQLPDGWNSNPAAAYALTYKHRLKAGKQFLLNGAVLADGALLAVSVTEKGGLTAGAELDVAEFAGVAAAAALKARLQALTRQLVPQLDPANNPPTSSSSSSSVGVLQQPQQPQPIFGGGHAGGTGGFPRIPAVPSVGSGDLHPALPGPGFGPDTGAGSLVGPGHPLFGADPYGGGMGGGMGGGGGALGPTPPGWAPGLPRPRFDPYGPVPGPNNPGFGNPGFFPGGGMAGGDGDPFFIGGPAGMMGPLGGRGGVGGRGGAGGRGGRGPLGGWAPGEPNPDHLRPPQHDRHDFT
jgi:hypothetical protein